MPKVTVIVNHINYCVIVHKPQIMPAIRALINKLTTYKWEWSKAKRATVRMEDKIYTGLQKHHNEYHFNINTLKEFMIMLRLYAKPDEVDVQINTSYPIKNIDITTKQDYTPKPYQQQYVDIVTNNQKFPYKYKLVDLDPGMGKTYISMLAIAKLKMLTLILILPRYIEKWLGDIEFLTDATRDEVYVIQGSKSLNNLLLECEELGYDNLPYKFIICSNKTMQYYIKMYELLEDKSMSVYHKHPQEFSKFLGIGVVLSDEIHQEFHSIFKTLTYIDAKQVIALSATLVTKNRYVNNMYDIMFPGKARISGLVPIKRYVTIHAIEYEFSIVRNLRFKQPQGYNHNLLETSIMRHRLVRDDYLEMIMDTLRKGHIQRTDGGKCIIFCASIDMCTLLANMITRKYPRLKISRYTGDDDYSNIIESDITVTTIGSAGTAIDIPDLRTVIQTVSVDSIQANRQSYGRLRDIDGDVRFYYLWTKCIDSQQRVHNNRVEVLRPRSKDFIYDRYHKLVRGY